MKISTKIKKLQLLHPFKIARRTTDSYREVITVEIDGGIGETSPAKFYGETVQTVEKVINELSGSLDVDLDAIQDVMSKIEQDLPDNYAAKSVIDMALHDRFGKKMGAPLYKLWGLNPKKTPNTSYTIGLDEPNIMVEKVYAAEEYPILKVKLGNQDDFDILTNIRRITNKPIYVDVNTAWSPQEAVEKIKKLSDFGVELVEQPTTAEDIDGLKYIRDNSKLPIIADESVKRAEDIPKIADAVDGINIKLVKCGGLLEAIRMIHVARVHGLLVMIGCMIESSIGITAAAHLTPLVDYADLDGNLLIKNDPYKGVTLQNGKLILPNCPGIGVAPVDV
ncbi:dipeptide epimerase [Candidatus Poribacteria bacterium]|nr:MAG: dipeptide epimerase [Candidatus Poribacteria bacterium]